jgi:hypothetical protein
MVSLDFESLSGAPFTVTNLIGNQLPSGSAVFIWDALASAYKGEVRTRSGWNPGTNVINRTQGMFIQSAAETSVYFMGEVPDRFTAGTTTVANVTGVNMYGFPYPVDVQWTNTFLAKNGQTGDGLFIWDIGTQGYIGYVRTRSGWIGAESVVIKPGQAFWFQTAGNLNWQEVKPYTWP